MKTILIGRQEWTIENLNKLEFNNGDSIQVISNETDWKIAKDSETPACCYFEYNPKNAIKYGVIYNWYAISDSRALAPLGYYIPTEDDWDVLVKKVGGVKKSGGALKISGAWAKDELCSNSSGFSALPGGYNFVWLVQPGSLEGFVTGWWAINPHPIMPKTMGKVRMLHSEENDIVNYSAHKGDGFYVRCLKNH